MTRLSPGVLVDHGSDWAPFVVPITEQIKSPPTAAVIKIGHRSMLSQLLAALGRCMGKRVS